MIVKKVPTSRQVAPKSKALNVRALVDYIAGPRAGGDREKVEYRGALNLLNIDHDGQVQEMIDLAELARRSPQPVQHWILSWREGEQPSPAQADEAVVLLLEEMGLSAHQAVYALHRNTKNCHLHLAVNRVHPDTEKLITVNNGFDHEVAHRAIARIPSNARAGNRRTEDYSSPDRTASLRAPGREAASSASPPALPATSRSGLGSAAPSGSRSRLLRPSSARRQPGAKCTRLSVASRFALNGRAQAPSSGLLASP